MSLAPTLLLALALHDAAARDGDFAARLDAIGPALARGDDGAAATLRALDAELAAAAERESTPLRRERALADAWMARLLRRETGADGGEALAADARSRARHALELLEDEWRATRDATRSRLRDATTTAVAHEALLAAQESGGDEAALATLLELEAIDATTRAIALPPVGARTLRQALLAQGEVALDWLPCDDATHLFVVTATSALHLLLPGRATLAGRAPTRDELLPVAARAAIAAATFVRLAGGDRLGCAMPLAELALDGDVALAAAKPVSELPSLALGIALRWRRVDDREHATAWLGDETAAVAVAVDRDADCDAAVDDEQLLVHVATAIVRIEGSGDAAIALRSAIERELDRGATVAEALRRARLAIGTATGAPPTVRATLRGLGDEPPRPLAHDDGALSPRRRIAVIATFLIGLSLVSSTLRRRGRRRADGRTTKLAEQFDAAIVARVEERFGRA